MGPKSISVIIPTANSIKIDNTLQAITRQTALRQIEEIIIVGEQSLPSYPQLPQLRYIYVAERRSPARNRNEAAKTARGEFLCFTDSDCIPKPDWIEELLIGLKNHDGAVAGSVDVPKTISYWGLCDHLVGFEHQALGIAKNQVIPYAATLNFSITRDVFLSIHGFDETFEGAGGEDREFCWRLKQAGFQIKYHPRAIVIHDHPRNDFMSAWNHIYHYGVMNYAFRKIHANTVSPPRRVGFVIAKIPIIAEITAIFIVLVRLLWRLIFKRRYQGKIKYLPGIYLLDLSHTLGIFYAIRSNAINDRGDHS